MPVRRTAAFVTVAIMAILACGIGSARADAATTSMQRGQAAASPAVLLGGHCVTVHANAHGRTGTICLYLTRQSGKAGGQVGFTARSGTLRLVSVQALRVSVAGQVALTVHNMSLVVIGHNVALRRNWWDEPKPRVLRMSAMKACMTWTDGSKACTGTGWVSTQAVRV